MGGVLHEFYASMNSLASYTVFHWVTKGLIMNQLVLLSERV